MGVDSIVLWAIEKKGIFELYEYEVSWIGGYEEMIIEVSIFFD